MYGIITAPNGKGWAVSLRRNNKVYLKHFTYSIWGGVEPALLAAQAWRDQIVRRHKPQMRADMARKLRKNNTTGIAGVVCVKWPDGSPRKWVAKTQIAGIGWLTKVFGVSVYGFDEAKRLAIEEREKQLKKMKGRASRHAADLPPRGTPPTPVPKKPDLTIQLMRERFERPPRPENKSGVTGVNCRMGPDGQPMQWRALTRGRSKTFSVRVHGYEKARDLAIAARRAQIEEILAERQAKRGG